MRADHSVRRLERALSERPNDATLHFELGRVHLEQGDHPDALRCFEKAASLDPYLTRAHFCCGVAYTCLGSLDLAVREWQKMVDADGDLDLEGAVGARPAQVAAALKAWEHHRRTARDSVFKAYHVGLACLVLGQPAEALGQFDQVVAINPSFERVRYYRGFTLQKLGRPLEAADEFLRSTEGRTRDPQAWFQAGSALMEAGRTAQAVSSLQRAIQEWPGHVKALCRLAQAEADSFRLDQALRLLDQALQTRADCAEAHFLRARCLERQYVMEPAAEAYLRAVKLRPDYREAHFQLGLLFKTLGRHEQALEHLRTCIALDAGEAEPYYYVGSVLAALGRHEEAVLEFQRAVALSSCHAYAHYALGQSFTQLGRLDDAVKAFQRASELNPRDVQARSALGIALFNLDRLSEAIREFGAILQENPRDPEAHYFMGAAWFKLGNLEEAIEEYQKASNVDPASPLGRFSKGAAFSRSGDYAQALEEFRAAAQFRPTSEADLGVYATMQLLASIGIEHARQGARLQEYAENLEQVYLQFVQALSSLLDARDRYTRYHSRRVATIASHLARSLELPDEQVKAVQVGGHLHDIGKIGIPDEILRKVGELTAAERALVQLHPQIGADRLVGVPFPWEILPIIRHHHERWDGSGYPGGLRGEEIPLTAQIVGLADFYDALTTHRPYRRAFTPYQAMVELNTTRGILFNSDLVAAFERILDDLVLLLPAPAELDEADPSAFSDSGSMEGLALPPSRPPSS